jgi:tRNA1Val (adenine37-N6)-methyltransferase
LRRRGRLALIYPAVRCVDVLAAMRAAGIEPKRLKMVHSCRGSEASLILAEGIKGGQSEIVVQAPLIIYEEAHRYSTEVAAMLGRKTPGSE